MLPILFNPLLADLFNAHNSVQEDLPEHGMVAEKVALCNQRRKVKSDGLITKYIDVSFVNKTMTG